MSKGVVCFLDTTHPFLPEALQGMGYETVFCFRGGLDQISGQLRRATGLVVRSRLPIDCALLERAPFLRFVARVGSGLENIDLEAAGARGIQCLNAPEGNRDAVGEHALGLLLAVMNHLARGNDEVRRGLWKREANRGHEIGGKTVAIIGYGNTGGAFTQRLQGFGARVIAYDKYRNGFGSTLVEEAPMEEVFRTADILSLHVPLTEETRSLVDREYIRHFHRPFWLINTSRGPVVSSEALAWALDEGRILGAGLDVLEYEKRSLEGLSFEDFPEAFRNLIARDNVIFSPHVAGWTDESLLRLAQVLAAKIKALDVA